MSISARTTPFPQMQQPAESPCFSINNTGRRMLPSPEGSVITSQENICSRSIKVVSGSNSVSLELKNRYNEHRLMAGCRERNRAIMEEELRRQPKIINHTFVDKSEQSYHKRCKLLHFSIEIGDTDIVNVLLQRGVDVHQRNNLGSTALHLSTEKGNIKIVHALLRAKADVNAADNEGDTPLHLAAYYKDMDIFNALIDNGANVNKKNHRGLAPLHIIAEYGPSSAALKLVTTGAIIDLQNDEGSMPLHLACYYGHDEIVKILLNHGAGTKNTISILKNAFKKKRNSKQRQKAQAKPVIPEISEHLHASRAMERQPLLQNSMQQKHCYGFFDNQGFDLSESPSPPTYYVIPENPARD